MKNIYHVYSLRVTYSPWNDSWYLNIYKFSFKDGCSLNVRTQPPELLSTSLSSYHYRDYLRTFNVPFEFFPLSIGSIPLLSQNLLNRHLHLTFYGPKETSKGTFSVVIRGETFFT